MWGRAGEVKERREEEKRLDVWIRGGVSEGLVLLGW